MNPTATRPAARTAALVVAGAALRFTHLAVAYAIVIGNNRATLPFVLALLLGFPPAMEALRVRGKRVARAVLGAAYYGIVAAYLAAALYVVGPMGPPVFAGFAVLAVLFGLLLRRGARPPVLAAIVIVAALHAANLAPGVAVAVAALFAASLLLRRTEARIGIGALPLAVALFATMVHVEAATFYRGVSLFDRLRQPDEDVTALPYGGPLRLMTKADGDPRYLLAGCRPGTYVYGARGRDHALELLDDARAEPIATALPGAEAGDNAVVDCARGVVWAGDYASDRLYRLRASDLAVEKTVTLPHPHPTFLELDPVAGELYVASDFGGELAVLDADSGDLRRSLAVPGGIAHFALDPKGRRVFAVGGGGQLHVAEAPAWQPRQVGKFPGALLFQLAYVDGYYHCTLYLGNFLTGMIYAIDGKTFVVTGKRWVGSGLRFLAVRRDTCAGDVEVANYFSGRVTGFSSNPFIPYGGRYEPYGGRYVGKRVRWMAEEESSEKHGYRMLTTSTYGPIAIGLLVCVE